VPAEDPDAGGLDPESFDFSPEPFPASDPEPDPSPPEVPESEPPPDASLDAAFVDFARALDVLRSFFAQPEPLKWIDGAENPFRTGPSWQRGQVVGPSALMPWITSKRCPQ
jgi:hypothetical protein